MSDKLLLLLVLLAVATCHGNPLDLSAVPSGDVALNRIARSPQRRVEARSQHSRTTGVTSSVTYNHPINKHVDAYASARRNEKYNDNSGHAGLKIKF